MVMCVLLLEMFTVSKYISVLRPEIQEYETFLVEIEFLIKVIVLNKRDAIS